MSRGLFPEEQKGCRKRTRGTGYLLSIDQHILKERTTRRKNVTMAYDMVLRSWIIDYLKKYKISDEVIKFIENTMKNWRVKQKVGGKSLAEGKIQRGIFQGDVLSPLLFVIAIMQLNHILRKCTGEYKLHKLQKNQPPNVHGHHTVCKK